MEIWKDIDGYSGIYQVSNLGRVRSTDRYVIANCNGGIKLLKGKLFHPTLRKPKGRKDGYYVVNLQKKTHLVHALVLRTFVPNIENKPTVNHKDGNKKNNKLSNLEWATYSENNQHALDNNLRKPRGVTVYQRDSNMKLIKKYKSASEASRITKISRGMIVHCLNNRSKRAGEFIWTYK